MSLLSSVRALRGTLGGGATFAATQVLNVCLPGSGAVVELVGRLLADPAVTEAAEGAADAVDKLNEERWKAGVAARLGAAEGELDRVAELLDVLRTQTADLLDRVAEWDGLPDDAERLVERAVAESPAVREAVRRLEEVARRVDRHERQIAGLVAGQEEMRPLVERAVGASGFVDEWAAAGLTPTLVRDLRKQRAAARSLVGGDAAAAERAFAELAAGRAGSPAAAVGVAAAQAAGGRFVEAERSLTAALRLRPDDPDLQALHARATKVITRRNTPAAPPAKPDVRQPQEADTLDGWLLGPLTGRGGWGRVHRATKAGRAAALKVLHPELNRDPVFVGRFKAEMKTLMQLGGHPALVGIDDFGRCDEFRCWYFVMPFVGGPTLAEHLSKSGPLAADVALGLFGGLADGLAAAHRRGIAHRDIKPENVLLPEPGRGVLVDFGLAALVGTPGETTAAGYTALFAAPEHIRTGQADARSDVYALAATLHFALRYDDPKGRDPHRYKPDRVPEGFRAALTAGLQNDPDDRPADAAAFLALLAPPKPAAVSPVTVAPPPPPEPARPTLVVCANGTGQYREIADAVEAAQPGTLITVKPGTYRKGVDIDKDVEVAADGPREAVRLSTVDVNALNVSGGSKVLVRGLTIEAVQDKGKHISTVKFGVGGGRGVVEDCDIVSADHSGVTCHSSSHSTFRRCTIRNGKGSAVGVFGQTVVENCEIRDHGHYGVLIFSGGDAAVRTCRITANGVGAVKGLGNSVGVVEGCDIRGNKGGPWHIERGSKVERRNNQE